MKKITLLLINVLLTIFLEIVNFNFLTEKLDDYNYITMGLFTCWQCYYSLKRLKLSVLNTFLTVLLVVLIIDATTLITGDGLIPLRFPFYTIFPILGFFAGICFFYKKIFYGFCLTIFYIGFCVLSVIKLVPSITIKMQMDESKKIKFSNRLFNSSSFLTADSTTFSIPTSNIKSYTLLDIYFVGCGACEEKFIFLDSLLKKDGDKIDIYCICVGRISSFEQFQQHAKDKRRKTKLHFLYDNNKIVETYFSNLNGYPFEVIVDKNLNTISTCIGFNSNALSAYWKKFEILFSNK